MKILKVVSLNLVLILLFSEVLLRVFWQNPARDPGKNIYVHHGNVHIKLRHLDRVYAGAPDPVYFNTSSLGFIQKQKSDESIPGTFAIAVGGSTTECFAVQEGFRWPDLLKISTLNYGKSSMYSYHTYFNMIYILEKQGLRPQMTFVMDGLNNLSQFLSGGPKRFLLQPVEETITKTPWQRLIVSHFYTAFFLFRLNKYNDMTPVYRDEVKRNQAYPLISEEDLHLWLKENTPVLKSVLKNVYQGMYDVNTRYGSKLVVLTQPHSYQESYRPYREDFRVYPVINQKRLDVRQSRDLMKWINQLTLETAHEVGAQALDVASCFETVDTSDLIYDGWHYSQKGSVFFAECLNRLLF